MLKLSEKKKKPPHDETVPLSVNVIDVLCSTALKTHHDRHLYPFLFEEYFNACSLICGIISQEVCRRSLILLSVTHVVSNIRDRALD